MKVGVPVAMLCILFAGCTGGGAATDAPPTDGIPAPSETQGVLRGRVLSQELVPLANATVAIPTLSLTQLTGEDGGFALPPLDPGDYDVSAYALGYQAIGKQVTIVAAETTEITFTLEALASGAPYSETFPYVGFEACQWYFEGAIAHCTLPYTQAYGTAKNNGVNLSAYGAPKDLQDNRDRYNFTVGADHTGIVSELIWQASSAAAVYQALILACGWYDVVWDECVPPGETHTGMRYHFQVGTSPVKIQWKMDEEQLKYRERSPWIMSRANVYGSDSVAAGFAFEQRIEMYNTVFYGADPPEDFTAGPPDA